MKTMFLVAVMVGCLGLMGCQASKEYAEPCGGYGCQYDGETELGILYRDDSPNTEEDIPVEMVDRAYYFVSECMGVWYEPHLFVVNTPDFYEKYVGQYIELPEEDYNLVLIRPLLNKDAQWNILRHEYVHHLLKLTTGNADSGHVSPLFAQCSNLAG